MMGFTKYLKAAFLNQWNLLLFLGAAGFAALSGRIDVFLPLVLAGEVTYLGLLGTHPKFQRAIDGLEHQANRQAGGNSAEATVNRILRELPAEMVQRFTDLRSRCAELRQISRRMREPVDSTDPPPLDDIQIASLDRLLWMYLRLIYTQFALSQFLQKTSVREIESNIKQLEKKLATPSGNSADERLQRVNKVVEDNLQTSRSRLANYRKAQENYEMMELEIDRLENTIQSLSELAVNRQEPNFISGQIDQVAASMVQTEKTMGELQFVTGLKSADDEVPPILRSSIAVES